MPFGAAQGNPERTDGAEESIELGRSKGWTMVSMKNDWKTVFRNVG